MTNFSDTPSADVPSTLTRANLISALPIVGAHQSTGHASRPSSAVTTFNDPFDFQRTIRGTELRMVLNALGDYHADLTRIDLPHLWIQHSRQSLGQVVHFGLPSNRTAIHLLADTYHPPVFLDGKEVSADDLICYSPGAEHHFRTAAKSHWLSMSLPTLALAEAGCVIAGHELATSVPTRLIRVPAPLMLRLRSLHNSAAHLARNTPEILAHPEVARAVEHELICTTIACITTDSATKPIRYLGGGRVSIMQRFESAVYTKQYEPIYLPEICAEIGVTDRTLRLHCQEYLGMSPYRYLWLRRMHLARRALASADPVRSSVTLIATDYGFGELGRFAVEYRKLFGEAPSATLRRAPIDKPFAPDQDCNRLAVTP